MSRAVKTETEPEAKQVGLFDQLEKRFGATGPRARRTDPDTSHEAGEALTEKRLSDIQTDVLSWFRTVKRATDEQLETHFRDKYTAQTTVSKRRTDLVRLGYLRDSGERQLNSNNRRMIIWEIAD